jgi:2-dehydro-3-deoxygluconokinase
VHLTGITPALSAGSAALVEAIVERRRQVGMPVSFDVNHRAQLWPDAATAADTLAALARRADLVFVGRDEAEGLWGTGTADEVDEFLGIDGTLVVKDGASDAVAFTRRNGGAPERVAVAPAPVDVIEPVGAGDAFAAGYLAATLTGSPVEAALTAGHRVAAGVLGRPTDY